MNSLPRNKTGIKRFSRNFPCPICGGCPDDPRGEGRRCWGFLSGDGEWAHCTRANYAGGIPLNTRANTYPHRMHGPCKCGKEHGPARSGHRQEKDNRGEKRESSRTVEKRYDYLDANGKMILQVCRTNPKGFFQQRPDGNGGWIRSLKEGEYYQTTDYKTGEKVWYHVQTALDKGRPISSNAPRKTFPEGKRILYHLSELLKADPSEIPFIVEGERDVERLEMIELVATCNPEGAGKWHFVADQAREIFRGKPVVILPDNDKAGQDHALDVARSLYGAAASIKVVNLPGLPEKGDVSDWIEARLLEGMSLPAIKAALLDIVNAAPEWTPPADNASTGAANDESPEEKESKPTVAAILIRMSQDAELFHTKDDRGVATFPVGEHRETAYIKSLSFRRWLRHRYFKETQKPPNSEGMQQAIETLEGIAIYEGKPQEVYIRTAVSGENIYIDLGNENWEAVQCTPNGWDVIAHPPVKFIRPSGMLPLPAPEKGNALDLRPFINVKQESDLQLLLSWTVNAYRPGYPFPVLVLLGEQGSAKTTASRIIRALIDPNDTPIRSAPREERDLYVSAKAGWVMVFDNLSGLPNHLSDALCRLSTGGGFAVRELYSDSEEIRFNAMRPVILNGITDVVTRPDLLDRSLIITLEPIPENQRKTEEEIWTAFDQAAPAILGGLLDAVCAGLRNLNSVNLPRLPRMADFARFATAAETGLGFQAGDFMKAYTDNRKDAISSSLDVDPLAQAIREMVDGEEWFEGTAAELLEHLETMSVITDRIKRSRTWPQSARGLRSALKRIRPLLAGTGIMIEFSKAKRHGHYPIRAFRLNGETTSPTSPTSPNTTQIFDSIDDTLGDIEGDVEIPTSPTSPNIPRNIPRDNLKEINQLENVNSAGGTLGMLHPPIIGQPSGGDLEEEF